MTTLDATEAVARGAAFLDERRPGWFREINLSALDQNSTYQCVVAQLHGHNFYAGADALEIGNDLVKYGFSGNASFKSTEDSYAVRPLDDAWKKIVRDRMVELPPATLDDVEPVTPTLTVTVRELQQLVDMMANGLVMTATLDFKGVELTVTR